MSERAKGTAYKVIADMIGRPLNGCEQRYTVLRRLHPDYQPRKKIEPLAVTPISTAKQKWRFIHPEKRRCLREDCRQWFKVTYAGQYFCIGHRPSDDTGMVERTANYRSPARAGF